MAFDHTTLEERIAPEVNLAEEILRMHGPEPDLIAVDKRGMLCIEHRLYRVMHHISSVDPRQENEELHAAYVCADIGLRQLQKLMAGMQVRVTVKRVRKPKRTKQ